MTAGVVVAPMATAKCLCVFHLLSVTTTELKFFVCVLCLRLRSQSGGRRVQGRDAHYKEQRGHTKLLLQSTANNNTCNRWVREEEGRRLGQATTDFNFNFTCNFTSHYSTIPLVTSHYRLYHHTTPHHTTQHHTPHTLVVLPTYLKYRHCLASQPVTWPAGVTVTGSLGTGPYTTRRKTTWQAPPAAQEEQCNRLFHLAVSPELYSVDLTSLASDSSQVSGHGTRVRGQKEKEREGVKVYFEPSRSRKEEATNGR